MKNIIIILFLLSFSKSDTISSYIARDYMEEHCINTYNERSRNNIDSVISNCLKASEASIAVSMNNLEAVIYLLRSYYFKGKYATHDEESKKVLFDKGKDLAEKYIKQYPDNAAIRYWYLVNLGSWAEVYGTLKAAREGVADIMKEQSEAIIKLDPYYKDGGGYFMLGAVHLKSPYIPFLLSWPDKDKAVEYLSKAMDTGKATLVQKRYLAHALYKTGQEEHARELLNEVINSNPSEDEYIEDLEDIREAELLLKSF